ncbi:unnamed protein product [Pedinophyceae sp. YPF-701]|nr:unnamed protein product [Pedinophyceae sp. YPF-701]
MSDEEMIVEAEGPEGGEAEDSAEHTFQGHADSVYSVAWCPGSRFVATGSGDDTAYLWEAAVVLSDGPAPPDADFGEGFSGLALQLTGHTDTVACVAFSASGQLLATAGMDGVVLTWQVPSGEQVARMEGPGDAIECLAWHPKGDVVLAGSSDFTTWMWDGRAGSMMQVFTGHSGEVRCASFSADGKLVLTGSADGSLRVWSPKTGACVREVSGHQFHAGPLTTLVNHVDRLVVTGGEDGRVNAVNIDTGRVVTSAVGHQDSVESISLHRTQPYAATASSDGKVVVWDSRSFQKRLELPHPLGVVKALWLHVDPVLVTACLDGVVRAFDGRTGNLLVERKGHTDHILDACVSPDGWYVLTGGDDSEARVFSLRA